MSIQRSLAARRMRNSPKPVAAFFDRVYNGEYVVLLSAETLRELSKSPESVQAVWQSLTPDQVEEIRLDDGVQQLATGYLQAGVLGNASFSDALHVAAATISGADLILSWNFKHIVNYSRILGYNSVNIRFGYRNMTILSPLEVVYE